MQTPNNVCDVKWLERDQSRYNSAAILSRQGVYPAGAWMSLEYIWVFPKMVGFPNKPIGFPTKNDHFGVFGGTTILVNPHMAIYRGLPIISNDAIPPSHLRWES